MITLLVSLAHYYNATDARTMVMCIGIGLLMDITIINFIASIMSL